MIKELISNKLITAGPCALESRQQLRECVSHLKQLRIPIVRASLWKPRTLPGWEGLGRDSLPVLLEETLPHGLIPATEIISSEHAQDVVNVLKDFGSHAKMLVWLGARNQNHLEQQKMARILAEGPHTLHFMFKNQMWDDERHWIGIYEHIIAAGFPKERLMMCHRGFSPGKMTNPEGYRNLPDFEMAMRVKKHTGLPMILDPSHIAGSKVNVFKVMEEARQYDFDGYMIEVHTDPEKARTDANQQLSMNEFQTVLKTIKCEDRSTCHG